jgi:hypothetical protein
MENQDIKRGVDFETRFGEQSRALDSAFLWWRGEKFNKKTVIFLSLLFTINFIIVFPILGKDFSPSYASSSVLLAIAGFLKYLFISPQFFFSILTLLALCLAPINFYLFVRRVAMRHEITAFLASLFFIIPNPFFGQVPITVTAFLQGDGAHALVFSFLPLFLLYVQAFLKTGIPALAVLCVIGTAAIAVISPFAAFNLLIILFILTIAEGFLGSLRVKLLRLVFLLFGSSLLASFWYYPNVLSKIAVLSHVKFAFDKFTSLLPLAVPIIPVAGALSFLIFDRREKLNPVFISTALFLSYFSLYNVSRDLAMNGVFTADRYGLELGFSSAFFAAILCILLTELGIQKLLPKIERSQALRLLLSLQFISALLIGFFTLQGFAMVQKVAEQKIVANQFTAGIGGIKRTFSITDFTSLLWLFISLATLFCLFYILSKYSSSSKNKKV